ncbi:glycosyltransferase family 2 protein [Paraburkholderia domus]|jgi:hypothetical protein|uniref:glycosyltransferase family 2 protein n=1 Tax=Paraburkholderia domus TaxID=2793075 RepID=UPI001912F1F5|nr:glycosyltransferase family 2 protein [Paraburkholderia domus]MBK5066198.1 hypothetical protein [Burkholderia sp. R-70199]CAE6968474.1 hypothetical protein R70199_07946 [Paraburkholderia domus]
MTPSILFLVFNRPASTAKVFSAIRAAKPRRLYIGADGPRANNPNDTRDCREVRKILSSVDWPCEVRTWFRSDNVGCRAAVREAITWFFENEEEGIILEDDCVPHPAFFRYTQCLLQRFREDQRIMSVTGTNVFGSIDNIPSTYLLSIYSLCWGWATWARAWRLYDDRLIRLDEFLSDGSFAHYALSLPVARRWEERFRQVRDFGLDSWATVWTFACWANNGLTCTPRTNLVSNIGFGPSGTHTWDKSSRFSSLPTHELAFPLKHPAIIAPDSFYDGYVSSQFYGIDPADQTSVEEALARNLQLMRDHVRNDGS